jgi:polysaccharide export outer membrane protein
MDVSSAPARSQDYRIGASDKLDITVFEVKDLSLEKAKVDSNGMILFPLIGEVTAAGKTTSELSNEIAARLGERYLANPHVSVLIEESAAQKVTVDGVVGQPGVYDIAGQTGLLQAVALAKGPGKDADLRHVAVFRYMNGRRMAAMFDLRAIRAGRAADPNIFPGDIVVVGGSAMKGAWRELIAALPAVGVFAWF